MNIKQQMSFKHAKKRKFGDLEPETDPEPTEPAGAYSYYCSCTFSHDVCS